MTFTRHQIFQEAYHVFLCLQTLIRLENALQKEVSSAKKGTVFFNLFRVID